MAVNFLPLLSAGMTALGSLFGNQKNESSSGNTTQQGATAATTQSTLKGTTATSQNTNQSSNQNTSTTGTQSQKTNLTEAVNGVQTGKVTRLDDQTLAMLKAGVADLFKNMSTNNDVVQNQIASVAGGPDFNVDEYVNGIMTGATDQAKQGLESDLNSLSAGIGATSKSNSAAALLGSKIKTQVGASLAETKAQATAQGTQLKQQGQDSKTNSIAGLSSATTGQLSTMLQTLLGANETTQQNTVQNTSGTNNTVGGSTQVANTTGATSQTSTGTETTDQSQTQNQTGTTGLQQTENASGSSGSLNWSDFLKGIGGMFAAKF